VPLPNKALQQTGLSVAPLPLAPAAERRYVIQTSLEQMTGPDSSVTVRAFRSADRDQVERLWARVFPDDPPSNAPALLIDTKLRVQPELFLIAVADGAVVGAVMAGFDGVRGWIHHLAVSPDHRRRGIATALVRAAESGLGRLGCPKVNLQVRATNLDVLAFYRQLGYGVEDRVSMGRRLEGTG